MRSAPFERAVIMWGWYVTTLTVHWRPATRLGPPLAVKHKIVLQREEDTWCDAGKVVRVPLQLLEEVTDAQPAGATRRASAAPGARRSTPPAPGVPAPAARRSMQGSTLARGGARSSTPPAPPGCGTAATTRPLSATTAKPTWR